MIPVTKDGKSLYCIAYEWYSRAAGKWKADMLYLHATDDGDARLQFLHSEQPETMRRIHVVAIAPVIGYHVEKTRGDGRDTLSV